MKAYNGIKNVDTIINGHTPAQTTWADSEGVRRLQQGLGGRGCRPELKAGKTPEQAAAEWKLPEKYRATRQPSAPCSAAWPDASRRSRRK